MQFPPVVCCLIPHRPKYIPQHRVLKHSAYVRASMRGTKSHIHLKHRQNYNYAYFNHSCWCYYYYDYY